MISNTYVRNKIQSTQELLSFSLGVDVYNLGPEALSLYYKNIVIHTSSVVELLLFFLLYQNLKNHHEIRSPHKIIEKINFSLAITLSKELRIINNQIFTDCNKLRKYRNEIHLYPSNNRETLFTFETADF